MRFDLLIFSNVGCIVLFSLASLRLLLALLLLHLLLNDAGRLLRSDLFQHILHLEDSLVVNWLVDLAQQRLIPNHSLGELNVRDGRAAEVIDHVLDEYKGLILDFLMRFCFS
jgi:hypothetical protein